MQIFRLATCLCFNIGLSCLRLCTGCYSIPRRPRIIWLCARSVTSKGALSGQHGRFLQVSTTSGFTLSPASTLAWESVLSLTDEMAQQCVNCRLIATNLLPWKTSTGHRHSRVTSLESQTLQSSRLATFLCISTVLSWLRSRTRCRIIVRHRRVIWVAPSLWSTKGALHEKTAVFSRN